MHAFIDKNIIWYSRIYGDFNDDLLVVGVDESVTNCLEQKRLNQVYSTAEGPVTAAIGHDAKMKEYLLTDEVAAEMGIAFTYELLEGYNSYYASHYDIKDENPILYQIDIHDDCFFYVKPRDTEFLPALVHCILQQHSFYLGEEVDWSGILDPTIKLLKENKSIKIKCRPPHRMLIKPERHGIISFVKDFIPYHFGYNVIIREGKAYSAYK